MKAQANGSNNNKVHLETPSEIAGAIDVMSLPYKTEIVWGRIFLHFYLHTASLYGLYSFLNDSLRWQTFVWTYVMYTCGGLGVTAGAHRFWSHKSFKANLPLKLILVILQTVSFETSIYTWTREHRVHHTFSETNADPHNAKRGFFFAHMGWLFCRKHPAVKEKGRGIDMFDLKSDPIVMFQKKYYTPLAWTISLIIPTFIPWYFWGETFTVSWFFTTHFRFCYQLHCTWLVNSAAHLWGGRPYDKSINPAENKLVAFFALGEGWHNYHHVFPWDYKTSELGHYKFNLTTALIDFFAWIGWAYDLKTVSDKTIRDRVARTGDADGSWRNQEALSFDNKNKNLDKKDKLGMSYSGPWGWGDKDIPVAEKEVTETLYPLISDHED